MNRIYLTILLLFPMLSLAQSPEAVDTVKLINNPEKVTVSRSGDTTLIEVETPTSYGKNLFSYEVTVAEPSESDPLVDFEIPFGIGRKKEQGSAHRRLQTSVFALGHLYVGQRFNYSDKGAVKNHMEAGVRDVLGIRWSHGPYTPSFSIGLGFGVQNYGAQDGFIYVKDGSRLTMVAAGDGCKVKFSMMSVVNFQIPLLLTLPIGRDVTFAAGAVGCFNTYAQARTELDFGSHKTTTLYKGLQQRLFTAELTATLGICDIIGVYASWSPMTLFQSPYGPQLRSWSIGGTINF